MGILLPVMTPVICSTLNMQPRSTLCGLIGTTIIKLSDVNPNQTYVRVSPRATVTAQPIQATSFKHTKQKNRTIMLNSCAGIIANSTFHCRLMTQSKKGITSNLRALTKSKCSEYYSNREINSSNGNFEGSPLTSGCTYC